MLISTAINPADFDPRFWVDIDFTDAGIGVVVSSFEVEVEGVAQPKLIPLIPREQLQAVRDEMMGVVMAYARKHLDRIDAVCDVQAHNKLQRDRKEKGFEHEDEQKEPPALPPLLMNTTVGTGKSVLVQALTEFCQANDIPFAVTAPTHHLCNEHTASNSGMGHYYGRVDPDDDKGMPENVCYKLEDTERAGDHNHRVAASLCTRCEHGMSGAIKYGQPGSENVEKAIKWMERRKLDPQKIEPCRFLYEGLPAALAAPVLACPSAAFSEAIGIHMDPRSMRKMQRLVVVDEQTELTEEVEITVPKVHQWIETIDALVERLDKSLAFEQDGDEARTTKELADLLPSVRAAFAQLITAIAKQEPIEEALISELQKKVSKAKGSSGGTAKWEQIVRQDDGYQIPLRALNALAFNIRSGSMRRTKRAIHVYEIKPILRWAVDHGSVIFLDATASLAFKELIEAIGGEVFNRQVEQNINVLHVAGHLYARGKVPTEQSSAEVGAGDSYRRAAKGYMKEIQKIAERMPAGKRAILTHKAYLKYSSAKDSAEAAAEQFQEDSGAKIGWFGKHDRGHNDWKFHHIAIVGMPILSSDNIASAYAGVRAALMDVGVTWSAWDGIMQDEEMRAKQGGVPLPADDHVRAWLIDAYAATIVQSIGRARAVNSDDVLLAELWGGLQSQEMVQALLTHGIEVGGTVETDVHRSKRQMTSQEAVRSAISMLEGVGQGISKRSVREAITGLRISIDDHEIERQLAAMREAGEIPPPRRGRPKSTNL